MGQLEVNKKKFAEFWFYNMQTTNKQVAVVVKVKGALAQVPTTRKAIN